ncbi:MAG: family 78 glycoside hydrolase catalytic domain [Planctomycetia bacterium]|nr:family 78 glycoside hydrolase catalytic domain [Planctomycetia bacterium]
MKHRILSCAVLTCCLLAASATLTRGYDNIREMKRPTPSPNSYAFSVNGFHVVDFRVENLIAPEGIDTPQPRFSWKLFSQDLNERQSAYQLKVRQVGVFGSDGEEQVVWDSGKVDSDEQLYIRYGGAPLPPRTEFMAELIVWNNDGKRTSQVYAPFSTGLYPTADDPSPWKGKWISVGVDDTQVTPADITVANWIAYSNEGSLPVGSSTYRFTFDVPDASAVTEAIGNFTQDDRGSVYLNGVELGGSDNTRRAATRDLKANLVDGKNVLALRVENVGANPNPGGVLGAMYITTADGTTNYITDESWKAIEGFEPEYLTRDFDDSSWSNVFVLTKWGNAPWGEIEQAPLEKASPARYLANTYWIRKDQEVKRATVYISGLGYYECYINGVKLGDQICGPMYTDYDKRVPYNTFDVTDIFEITQKMDANDVEVSVVLGNGRYYALRADKCVHYGDPCLLMQMEVEYANGEVDYFVSDESWKGTANGPISENNDYDGEVADGRLAHNLTGEESEKGLEPGDSPRYLEVRFNQAWTVETPDPVVVVDGPKGKLVAQMIPPMRETYEIKAVAIEEKEPGRYIIDFGQNFVGVPRIKLNGKAGDRVQIRFAESLKDDGELYVDNLRTAKARDIYTLAGLPEGEIYEPRFTQHGGRYAELIGYPGVPTLDSVTGYTVTTDLPQIGFFETSNATISQIFQNIVWGTRGNYLSMPTDCPQRDERMGWQGDRAMECLGEMYVFDNASLYVKWLQDIEESQREDGNVSDVCPAYWQFYSPNVTWPSAQLLVPQNLALMFGEESPIAAHFDSRQKWLDFMLSLCNEDGTISRDNYGDWCVPPERPELIHSADPMRQTNRTLLATVYMINDLRVQANFADKLNKTAEAKQLRERADKMQEVFNKTFYNAEEGRYDNGSQTSCVLPLAFGVVPESEREKVLNTLINNIENVTNKHLGTGLIGGQWINRLLSDAGRIDLPYAFATHRDFPSWGYMIEQGATTIWELWNGDTADPAMNSGNHVMLVGDLTTWFFEYLAGIKADPSNPAFKHIVMRPNVVGDLTSVSAQYDSARGMILSQWEVKDGSFQWKVTIPANTTATVSVPTSNPESLGIQTTRLKLVPPEPNEIRMAKYERVFLNFDEKSLDKTVVDGRVEFELGCGSYIITAELQK